MRCGYCGRKLTDAAVAMGYCPSCGTHLAREAVPAPESAPKAAIVGATVSRGLPEPQLPSFPEALRSGTPSYYPPLPSAPRSNASSPLPDAMRSRMPSHYPASLPEAARSRTPSYFPPPETRTPSGFPPGLNFGESGERGPALPANSRALVDAAPSITPEHQRRSNPLLIGLILLLLLLGAGGSVLFVVAGTHGSGPLAGVFKTPAPFPTSTSLPTATSAPRPTTTPVPTATPFPTATPLPTVPPAPIGFTRFTSPDASFGLNYPTTWMESSTTQGTTSNFSFTSADMNEFVRITEAAQSQTTSPDIASALQSFVNATAGSSGYRLTSDATPQRLGEFTWTTASAVYMLNSVQQDIIGYAINVQGNIYIMIYTAPVSFFNTGPNSNFGNMVNSFTFLH